MGGRQSTTNTTVQESVSNIMMNVLINHTQNCSSTSTISQNIVGSTGDSGSIIITNNTLDAEIQSKLTCLMTAQLNQTDLSQIQSQLQNDISKSTIQFPNVNNQATNNSLTQKFSQYMSSNVSMNEVLTTAQEANIKQNIVASGGNNSAIIIDGNNMKAGMQIFSAACSQAALTALQKFANTEIASGKASQEEVNALQPFADTALGLGKEIGDVAKKGIGTFGNISQTMIIGFVVVLIVFIMFGKDIMASAANILMPFG